MCSRPFRRPHHTNYFSCLPGGRRLRGTIMFTNIYNRPEQAYFIKSRIVFSIKLHFNISCKDFWDRDKLGNNNWTRGSKFSPGRWLNGMGDWHDQITLSARPRSSQFSVNFSFCDPLIFFSRTTISPMMDSLNVAFKERNIAITSTVPACAWLTRASECRKIGAKFPPLILPACGTHWIVLLRKL